MICFGNPIELSDYFADKYRPCQLVGCARPTIALYEVSLRHWERWPGRVPLDRIDSPSLAQFAEWMLPGRSPVSVNSYMRPILAILHFAADEDDIAKAPKFRRLREPKRVPLAFTIDEFNAVMAETGKEDYLIGGIRAKLWLPSFFCADWESGLRVNALLSIVSFDMLLEQGGFYCQAEKQKDAEADWYPLSPATLELIQKIYDPRRKLVWPLDKTVYWLRDRLTDMMNRSGIYSPGGSCSKFHRLRKSTASYMAAAGLDAQKKMGHSSPKTTERYLDPRIVRSAKNNDLVPAPIPNQSSPQRASATQ
jgi:integrase